MKNLLLSVLFTIFLCSSSFSQEQFLAEVRLFAGNFAPRGWAFCHGQILPISQNQALFSLLGTTYGGDGRTTFALPDLRDRVPAGAVSRSNQGIRLGQKENGNNLKSDLSGDATTTDKLGLNYIIAITGYFPSRS